MFRKGKVVRVRESERVVEGGVGVVRVCSVC